MHRISTCTAERSNQRQFLKAKSGQQTRNQIGSGNTTSMIPKTGIIEEREGKLQVLVVKKDITARKHRRQVASQGPFAVLDLKRTNPLLGSRHQRESPIVDRFISQDHSRSSCIQKRILTISAKQCERNSLFH